MRSQYILSLLGVGATVASRCKQSSPLASPTVSIAPSSMLASSTAPSSSSSTPSASVLSSSSVPPFPLLSSTVLSSSSVSPSVSSASPAASSSIACTNLFITPNFSPAGDWNGYGSGYNPNLDILDPCDDRVSCYKATMTGFSTLLIYQDVNLPYTGTYTASLDYKVLSIRNDATLALSLNGVTIGSEGALHLNTAPLNEWKTLTVELTAPASVGGGLTNFGFETDVLSGNTVSIQFANAQLIPCGLGAQASVSLSPAQPTTYTVY